MYPERIAVRDRARFRFGKDGSLRLMAQGKPDGAVMPERKFWTFATGADHGDAPYGLGLAHHVYWPVFFKRGGMKLWMRFLDKYSMPTRVGKYPPGATEDERKKLLQAAAALGNDTAAIIPEGMLLELLETAKSGVSDYGGLQDRMDAAIAKVILSQTMTTDDGSSLAQAQVHAGVAQSVIKADADMICESFNESVVKWLVEWNFPNAAAPKVWRRIEEPPDTKTQLEVDRGLYEMGFEPDEEHIKTVYGEGYARRAPVPAPAPVEGAQFAEPLGPTPPGLTEARAARATLDAGAEAMAAALAPDLRKRIEELFAILDETGDLVLFRERLNSLIAADPSAKAVESLVNATVNARLLGDSGL